MAHEKILWRTLWSLQVPNKIKNLVWRACRNSLPTNNNLVRQTIIDNPTCDHCKHVPESALHAFWTCSELDVVREDELFRHCRRRHTSMDFKELLSWLITNDHSLEIFSTSVWLVWTQRNQVRMSQPSISVHQIPSSARERVAEFETSQPAPPFTPPDLTSLQAKWRPPMPKMVKINCNGAIFKEQKKSGIGVVIRNNNGLVMASMSKLLPQQYTPLKIEALAASTALEFATELGFSRAVLKIGIRILSISL
nr:uncharacterized protein LOC111998731 [Quercus suber]